MSHPANPPPYDAIYSQGPQTYPVQAQPQSQVMVHVPQHQQGNRGIIIGTTVDIVPSTVVCQTCNYRITTRTEIRPALRTHACAVCLFLCGLWPCCLVPYCLPSCNNVDHYCPKCNSYVGTYMG